MTIYEAQIAAIAADENKMRLVFPIGTPRTEEEEEARQAAKMDHLIKKMEEESDQFACSDHAELLG